MKLQVVQLSLSGFCWRETIRDYHGPEVGTRGVWSCQMGVVGPLSWNSMHLLVITKSGADKQTFAGLTSSYPLKAGSPQYSKYLYMSKYDGLPSSSAILLLHIHGSQDSVDSPGLCPESLRIASVLTTLFWASSIVATCLFYFSWYNSSLSVFAPSFLSESLKVPVTLI